MVQEAKTVRAFISSTFRDMHAERDHLMTVVFPELRERLGRLGIEFYDVDLRWGVPETGIDGERANSWAYCKQWIERVEPFFVCVLGQRYGWKPPAEPTSITEMEVRHAVLSGRLRRQSYFEFRGTPVPTGIPSATYRQFVDEEQQNDIERLKREIATSSGRPVRTYRCHWNGEGFDGLDDEFGPAVLEDLWSGVLRDSRYVSREAWQRVLGGEPEQFPVYTEDTEPIPRTLWERIVEQERPAPAGPLEADAEQMASFAASRMRWFHGRDAEVGELVRFITDEQPESRIGFVHGVAGEGKSALIARLAAELADSPFVTVTHFIGASVRSANVRGMLHRLNGELDRRGAAVQADDSVRQDTEQLRKRLARRLESHAVAPRIVLLIDGINQLVDGENLDWLPSGIGPNVRIVVSFTDDPGLHAALRDRVPGAHWFVLPPLAEDDVRMIVVDYLLEYCKQLDAALTDRICAMKRARNPLYLLVMLGELRTLGGDDMNRVVASLIPQMETRYPDAMALFEWVLERLEVFGAEAVRLWFTYLSLGRAGMSSRELSDLLARRLGPGAARTALRIERGIRRYLARRGAQLDFFHAQLRAAVRERYLRGDSTWFHRDIAHLMSERWRDGDAHAIGELPYHQAMGGEWEALHATLSDAQFQREKRARISPSALLDDAAVAVRAACANASKGRALLPIRFASLYETLRNDLPGSATVMTELVLQRDFTAALRLVRGESNRRLQFLIALTGAWQAQLGGDSEEAATLLDLARATARDGVGPHTEGVTLAAVRALSRAGFAEATDVLTSAEWIGRFIEAEKQWLATGEAAPVRRKMAEAVERVEDPHARCMRLVSLGRIAVTAGDGDGARALFDRALEDSAQIDDSYRKARALSVLTHHRADVDAAILALPPGEWRLCALTHLAVAALERGDPDRTLDLVDSAARPEHAALTATLQSHRPQRSRGDGGTVSGMAALQFLQAFSYDRKWLPKCLADLAVALASLSGPASWWAESSALEAATKADEFRGWYDEFLLEFVDSYLTAGLDLRARELLRHAQTRLGELNEAIAPDRFIDHTVRLAKSLDRSGDPGLLERLRSSLRVFADDASDARLLGAIAKGLAATGQIDAARHVFARAIDASLVDDPDERSRRLAALSEDLGDSLTVGQASEVYARLRRESEILMDLTPLASHTVMPRLAEAFHKSGDGEACRQLFAVALRAAALHETATDYVFGSVIEVAARCYHPEYGPPILVCVADLLARASFLPGRPAPATRTVDELFLDLRFLADTSRGDRAGAAVELASALARRIGSRRDIPDRARHLSRLKKFAWTDSSSDQVRFLTALASAAMEAGLHDEAREALSAAIEPSRAHYGPVLDALRASADDKAAAAWAPRLIGQILTEIARNPQPDSARQFASAALTLKQLGQRTGSLRAAWRALMLTRNEKKATERHRQRVAIARDLHDVASGWLSWILLERAERYFWRQNDEPQKYEDVTDVADAWLATGRRTRAEKLSEATAQRLRENLVLLPAKLFAQMTLMRDLAEPGEGVFVDFLESLARKPMHQFNSRIYSFLEHFAETVNDMIDPVARWHKQQQFLGRLPSIVPNERYRIPLEIRVHCSIARQAPEEMMAALRRTEPADARLRIIPEVAAEISRAPLDDMRWKTLLDLLVASLPGSDALRRVLASVILVAKDEDVPPIAAELLDSRMFV